MGLVKKIEVGISVKYKKRWREFDTVENYLVSLSHSKKLLSHTFFSKELIKYLPYVETETKRNIVTPETSVLEHLKSGYPTLFEELKALDKLIESSDNLKKELKNALFVYIRRKRFKFAKPMEKILNSVYVEELQEVLFEFQPSILTHGFKLIVEGDFLVCASYPAVRLSGDIKIKDKFEKCVNEFILKNKENSKKLVALWENTMRKACGINSELGYLKERVEHGEPLEGECQLCPRVIIKEEDKNKKLSQ